MEQMRIGFEVALKDKLSQKTGTFQNEESVLLKCFKHFDTDADGLVDMEDWIKAIEKIGIVMRSGEDLKHLFSVYDLHESGKVDYHEFADVLFRQLPVKTGKKKPVAVQEEEENKEIDVLTRLKHKLLARGVRGLMGLAKLLKSTAGPKKTMLTSDQLKKVLSELRTGLNDEETSELFSRFEYKKTGKLKYKDLLDTLKGGPTINERRTAAVRKAFATLDTEGKDLVPLLDFKTKFLAKQHPDVISGKRSEDDVLLEFIDTFELHHEYVTECADDDLISCAEFVEYYGFVSAAYNSHEDDQFCKAVEAVWLPELPPQPTLKAEESKKQETKVQPKKYFYLGETRASYKRGTSNASSEENTLFLEAKKEKEMKLTLKAQQEERLAMDAVERLAKEICRRGMRTLLGVVKALKDLDPKATGNVPAQDFVGVLKRFRIDVDQDLGANPVLSPAKNAAVDYNNFVRVLRGTLPAARKQLIDDTFSKLSLHPLSLKTLKDLFDPRHHPDVKSGKVTSDVVMLAFSDTLDLHARIFYSSPTVPEEVSEEQFNEYFTYLSATLPGEENDEKFAQIMEECWKFPEVPASTAGRETGFPAKTLLHPPFDTSSEPTLYVTTKEYMMGTPKKGTEEELRSERKLFEEIKCGLKSGGLRKIFAFLLIMFNATGTPGKERKITSIDLHDLLLKFNISLTPSESAKVFSLFDPDNRGYISDPNLISSAIIGTMGFRRRKLAQSIFSLLDREGTGEVPVTELKKRFTPSRAPDVIRKLRGEEEVRQEFVETFDLYYNDLLMAGMRGDKVDLDVFGGYYDVVSMSIEDDKKFEAYMTSVWSIDSLAYEKKKLAKPRKQP